MRIFVWTMVVLVGMTGTIQHANAQNRKKTEAARKRMKKQKRFENKVEEGGALVPSWYSLDNDGDGVRNGRDKCVDTPEGQEVTTFGCPPDADRDGIYDHEDECPTEYGPRKNNGCPWGDIDGDGVTDNKDDCPTVPGIAKFYGCPDTDGDGIPDKDDRCPEEKGSLATKGCPVRVGDSDGDGLADNVDNCPLTPGPKSNKGCPEIKPEEKAALEQAFKNLLFETGKDVIMESSYESLSKLASVLINNPHGQLSLEGHTDNVGDNEANLKLSQDRAASVKRYLERKGARNKIKTAGFGETKPVSGNETPEGRAKNRRVEMDLTFE